MSSTIKAESRLNSSGKRRRFVLFLVLFVYFWIGYNAYHEAEPSRHIRKYSLMERDYFRPDWHAGKLGEAFANQTLENNNCVFYAFSRLLFQGPPELKDLHRISMSISLPSDSFVLLLLHSQEDDTVRHGFRFSFNPDYPSGYIQYQDERKSASDFVNIPDANGSNTGILQLEKREDAFFLSWNNGAVGSWELPEKLFLPQLSIVSGPTGMIINDIHILGISDTGEKISVRDQFEQITSGVTFLNLWSVKLLQAFIAALMLTIILIISDRFTPFRSSGVFLLILLSWLAWGTAQYIDLKLWKSILLVLEGGFFLLALTLVYRTKGRDHVETRPSPATRGHILWRAGFVIFSLVSIFSTLWIDTVEHNELRIRESIEKEIGNRTRVKCGTKLLMTRDGSDFDWHSSIILKKEGIVEFVFRKYRGEDKNKSAWYTLTLSKHPGHQSGFYSTRQDFQVLLKPVPLEEIKSDVVKVHLRASGNRFTVTLNDSIEVSVRNDEYISGEVSLVPINKGVTVLDQNFETKEPDFTFYAQLRALWFHVLLWSIILMFIFLRWEHQSQFLSSLQQTMGAAIIFSPFWCGFILAYFSLVSYHGRDIVIIATGIGVLILCILSVLSQKSRVFFTFIEILILLVCLEGFLRITPQDHRFAENPIQSNIPEDLYWYRAASSRRWNSLIKHQLFRNGEYTAPFSRQGKQFKVRILCLGSSSTAGGYPQYVESIFQENGYKRVEVVDGGVPGTTTPHLINFYKNLLVTYNPDIVTLSLIRNDMKFLAIIDATRTKELETKQEGVSSFRSRMYYILNKFMLYRLYRFYLLSSIQGMEYAQNAGLTEGETENRTMQEALKLYRDNLTEFVHIARENDQLPYLIIEPFFMNDGYDLLPADRQKKAIETIWEVSRELNVPVIDFQRAMNNNRDDLFFIDDVHHNEYGKKFLGSVVYNFLEEQVNELIELKKDMKKNKLTPLESNEKPSHKKKNFQRITF